MLIIIMFEQKRPSDDFELVEENDPKQKKDSSTETDSKHLYEREQNKQEDRIEAEDPGRDEAINEITGRR